MNKIVPIDFEFNTTNEYRLNLVCCSMNVDGVDEEYWLFDNLDEKLRLKKRLLQLIDEGRIFLVFSGSAEAHSFISLNINPTRAKWIDLQNEWKMLTNHYHKYMYGDQLIDGEVRKTHAPSYGSDKSVDNSKAKPNLAACIFKLIGVRIDTEHKNKMRDIIISNNYEEITANKKAIMDYCTSDIKYLPTLLDQITRIYRDYFRYSWETTKKDMESLEMDTSKLEAIEVTQEEMLYRGMTSARTALIQAVGYPVNERKVRKFASCVKDILKDLCEDINGQFDEDLRFFKWNKKEGRYSFTQKPLKDWIESSEYKDRWMRTKPSKTKPNGDYSLKLDAWERFFSYRHEYPEGDLPAQVLRFLKTRRSLNGFLPKSPTAKDKTTFFDSLGSDGRVRCYLNPYGAQSARFQPGSTGFIPLKSAWMRSLIEPPKGKVICGIDYGSQEFLIAALVSNDKKMIEAYQSGDVYLYFAKEAGAVPKDGTKAQYSQERNVFKSTTLGISYLMGPVSLASKLTRDTGKKHTKEDAQELINKFNNTYSTYAECLTKVQFTYRMRSFLKLADGWVMFGDNDNYRSVSNVPIQGMGSCILRKAIEYAQEDGLTVIFPLHDAMYIEFEYGNLEAVDKLAHCMKKAFAYFFPEHPNAYDLIRLDANIWGPEIQDSKYITEGGIECKGQTIYVDERAGKEYERFKKYWED